MTFRLDGSAETQLKRAKNYARRNTQAWSLEKRIDCVTKYLVLGNRALVAELTGVNYGTLRVWMKSDWWASLEAEIKSAKRIEKSSKLTKIVDKALEAVDDRITNGNVKYDFKTKEVFRVPVSVLEAAKVANDLMQRQEALDKVSVDEVKQEQTQSIQDQLKFLANEFAKFNGHAPIQVVDMVKEEDSDAIHDEWEEGLQEGSGEVYEPAGRSEEEGRAEQGSPDDDEGGESS